MYLLVLLIVAGSIVAVARHRTSLFSTQRALVPAPSGEQMPTHDLPGWKIEFTDDFTTSTPRFLPVYSPKWSAYDGYSDTSHHGRYATDGLSTHDGVLDMHLRTRDGVPQTAAPFPSVRNDGKHDGQHYGRYAVRFRADRLAGYKTAWLLWPDSNDSQDGEIDFPEGDLTGQIKAFDHVVDDHPKTALAAGTGASYSQWHTAVTEWLPSGVKFYLDGRLVGHSSMSPHVAMHWILQTETSLDSAPPAPDVDGHVYVDWVAIYARD